MKSGEQHRTRTLWLIGALHAFTHLYQVALLPLYLRIQHELKLDRVEQATLLVTEERILSVMLWIAEAIPADSRWYPVFQRYLQEIGWRVTVFGGDPGQILPSPTGDGKIGKICGLIFRCLRKLCSCCPRSQGQRTQI